jgi:hypothetical protein
VDILAYILHRCSRQGFRDSLAPLCAGDVMHLMAQTRASSAPAVSPAQAALDALMGR